MAAELVSSRDMGRARAERPTLKIGRTAIYALNRTMEISSFVLLNGRTAIHSLGFWREAANRLNFFSEGATNVRLVIILSGSNLKGPQYFRGIRNISEASQIFERTHKSFRTIRNLSEPSEIFQRPHKSFRGITNLSEAHKLWEVYGNLKGFISIVITSSF
jgi:hypothetical protein